MLTPVHPGEVLKEEFMVPLGVSANALARAIRVPPNRVTAIVNGTRGVSANTALQLAKVFGTTPDFWLNLQNAFDLDLAMSDISAEQENWFVDPKEIAKMHLIRLVRNEFDGEPDIHIVGRAHEFTMIVDWKLGSDSARPNKRSREIRIKVNQDFIEDYNGASVTAKLMSDENVRSLVKEKLGDFVREHDAPKHIPPPSETWNIDSRLMRYP